MKTSVVEAQPGIVGGMALRKGMYEVHSYSTVDSSFTVGPRGEALGTTVPSRARDEDEAEAEKEAGMKEGCVGFGIGRPSRREEN